MFALGYASSASAPAFGQCGVVWPQWRSFAARFVQRDGRVVNLDSRERETFSEAQAYGLVFALIGNDRDTFERVLGWTRDNLAGGDLTDKLPAWKWGRRSDGVWAVIDPNSASDADVWIAYALLEAGRLWRVRGYSALGKLLAAQVAAREVVTLDGVGSVLTPGENGFRLDRGIWRLNPSYMPVPVLRRLALEDPGGPWNAIAETSLVILQATAKSGFAPDWISWHPANGFQPDPEKGEIGSFDAIRVYLWVGMTDPSDPLRRPLLDALHGMDAALAAQASPPLKVNAFTGEREGAGPVGFSGALMPYLRARRQTKLAEHQELRVTAMLEGGKPSKDPGYYDSALLMFGRGWVDNRFRFDKQGRLVPRWRQACDSARKTTSSQH